MEDDGFKEHQVRAAGGPRTPPAATGTTRARALFPTQGSTRIWAEATPAGGSST